MLAQKGCRTTTGHTAFQFTLRTLLVTAESAQVAITAGFYDEDIYLMVGNTDVAFLEQHFQRPGTGLLHGSQAARLADPDCQLDILACM